MGTSNFKSNVAAFGSSQTIRGFSTISASTLAGATLTMTGAISGTTITGTSTVQGALVVSTGQYMQFGATGQYNFIFSAAASDTDANHVFVASNLCATKALKGSLFLNTEQGKAYMFTADSTVATLTGT